MNGEKQNMKLENMIKNDEGIFHRKREKAVKTIHMNCWKFQNLSEKRCYGFYKHFQGKKKLKDN